MKHLLESTAFKLNFDKNWSTSLSDLITPRASLHSFTVDKLTVGDYSEAFKQNKLKKKNNLKELICSTMGRVRDNVEHEIFIEKIVKFQLNTGANAKILPVCNLMQEYYSMVSPLEILSTLWDNLFQ